MLADLKQNMLRYTDMYKQFLMKIMTNVPYLLRLSLKTRNEVLYSLRREFYQKDQLIFRTGALLNSTIFVEEGEIQLFLPIDEGRELAIDVLYQGSCLGFNSILQQKQIMFSAKAKSNVNLLILQYDTLDRLRDLIEELESSI